MVPISISDRKSKTILVATKLNLHHLFCKADGGIFVQRKVEGSFKQHSNYRSLDGFRNFYAAIWFNLFIIIF